MSGTMSWNIRLSINDGHLDDFKALMVEMCAHSLANEPDTLHYEWYLNESETEVHIYERYTDSNAILTHMGNFGPNFAERFMTYLTPKEFTVYGSASDAVKEVLAGLSPNYLEQKAGHKR